MGSGPGSVSADSPAAVAAVSQDSVVERSRDAKRRGEMGRLKPIEDGEIHEDSEDGRRLKKKKRNAEIFQQNFYEKEEAEMLLLDGRQVTIEESGGDSQTSMPLTNEEKERKRAKKEKNGTSCRDPL